MSVIHTANAEPSLELPETMRYRPLGQTGLRVSALSMGCMRLPEDQELNTRLVSRAIDLGVNYFETTRGYCGGHCQQRTAPGLKDKTKGVIVSGKTGIGPDTTAYGFRQEIERQLEILGLSHFKFFQVGWFSWGMIPHLLKRGGALDAIRQAQNEGLIQHVGFTGHDTSEHFIRCIETGLFDSLTVPYSLLNRMYEPTIRRAGELGVGVIAMCPVAGGALACDSPALRKALGMDLPTAEMALRFVLANPHVSTACSGMNAMEQLEQNVKTAKAFDPAKDADFGKLCSGLDRLRAALGNEVCTSCRYCLPCPQGIDIPYHLELYRNWKAFGLAVSTRHALHRQPAGKQAADCTACGKCETKCPNQLPVPQTLKTLARFAQTATKKRDR